MHRANACTTEITWFCSAGVMDRVKTRSKTRSKTLPAIAIATRGTTRRGKFPRPVFRDFACFAHAHSDWGAEKVLQILLLVLTVLSLQVLVAGWYGQ